MSAKTLLPHRRTLSRPRAAGIAVGAMVVLAAGAARAESGGFSLAGRMGTPGFGLEASKSLTPHANLRCGVNLLNYGHDLDADLAVGPADGTVHFDGQLHLKSVALLADVYPSTRFHLTGGLMFDRNTIRLQARPTGPMTVNDETYTADEIGTLTGTATTGGRWVPYAGIGFGNPTARGGRLTFLMDVGVVFQGKPSLTLTASGTDSGLAADVDAAAEQVNRDHLNKGYFRYYPVFSVGVGLRLF